jgi:hypothetical protein
LTDIDSPASPWPRAQAFFCDDVRHEVSNKVTLVGVYGQSLYSVQGGAPMPKLVAFLSFVYPLTMVGQVADIALLERGKPLLAVQVPLVQPAPMAKLREDQPAETVGSVNIPIEMVGFVPLNGQELQITLSVGAFRFESAPLAVIAPDPLPASDAQTQLPN